MSFYFSQKQQASPTMDNLNNNLKLIWPFFHFKWLPYYTPQKFLEYKKKSHTKIKQNNINPIHPISWTFQNGCVSAPSPSIFGIFWNLHIASFSSALNRMNHVKTINWIAADVIKCLLIKNERARNISNVTSKCSLFLVMTMKIAIIMLRC